MFECHVTVEKPTEDKLSTLKRFAEELGWKTSQIDGDPVLGEKVYFYFTHHCKNYSVIYSRMLHLLANLRSANIETVRSKIEHIIYDTKTGIGIE